MQINGHTTLPMSYRALGLIIVVAAMCGCAHTSPTLSQSSDDPSDRLMTQFGTFSPPNSVWTIQVSDTNRKLQMSRRTAFGAVGVSPSEWRAKSGWFAFVENDRRAWAYDGDRDLFLLLVRSDKSTVSFGPYGFPCPVPDPVFKRLSPAARGAIKVHERSSYEKSDL